MTDTPPLGPLDAQVWFSLFNHSPGHNRWNAVKKEFEYRAGGRDTLYDVRDAIAAQFFDLGILPGMAEEEVARPPVVNILFEGFGADPWIAGLKGLREFGHRMGCIFTERPGLRGFNGFKRGEMVDRQRNWPKTEGCFEFVFCLVPESLSFVKRYCDRAAHIELGFSPSRLKTLLKPTDPQFDFVFFGSHTPRRVNVADELRRKGYTVYLVPQFAKLKERNAALRNAKVSLGLKGLSGWGIHSNSRYCTSLHFGRPVVAESITGEDTLWSDIIAVETPGKRFFDRAIAMVDSWESEWSKQITNYERLLSPDKCLKPALDTVGFIPPK